ncbi:MAG: hypothetical protein OES24_10585 [Acidimicrobiia bacterium]|nr:hypothetical protein [Acidimicrobiia bacterium]
MDITTKPPSDPELHDPTGRHVRVAFVGKGGSGKSTISGTFARLLARLVDDPVVALDSDPLPGMPYALGIGVDDDPIPAEAVVEGPDGGPRWIIDPAMTADEFIERHAAFGPDGVRYLQFGNLWGHVVALRQAQFAWSQVVRELDPQRWHLVGDLPGGTRQPMAGWAKYADVVCVVVEPTTKSLLSARRLLNLRRAEWRPLHLLVVANKVNGPDDVHRIADRLAVEVSAVVPHDARVLDGDRKGSAPLDSAPDGPFADAVTALVERVVGLYPRVQPSTEVTS